jgi:hypothetical protein
MSAVQAAFRKCGPGLIAVTVGLLVGPALAADLSTPSPIVAQPAAAPTAWSLRFVPYGWVTSMKGTQTVRGRSAKVDASFIDIVDSASLTGELTSRITEGNGTAGKSPPFKLQRSRLFGRGARRLENRGPAGHFAFNEFLQTFRSALESGRQHAAQIEKALLGVLVVERLQ